MDGWTALEHAATPQLPQPASEGGAPASISKVSPHFEADRSAHPRSAHPSNPVTTLQKMALGHAGEETLVVSVTAPRKTKNTEAEGHPPFSEAIVSAPPRIPAPRVAAAGHLLPMHPNSFPMPQPLQAAPVAATVIRVPQV